LFAISFTQVLVDLGYAGLALLMLAETIFPPIPSEAVLPLAGYLVYKGDLAFLPALLTSTAGSVTGAVLLAEMARHGGRPFAERFVKFARQDPKQLERAEGWFDKHGSLLVLFGRFLPGVRSLVALPAGLLRMSRVRYIVLTVVGSSIWNTALISAGYILGEEWERVSDLIGPLTLPVLIGVVLIGAALFLWHRHRKRVTNRT
jgi:membrane protein DedA with SNARE-associated domain